jgi:hypothetical protein
LGVTHLREGYPLTQQASDWGDLAARYAAVVLTDGAAQAAVIPELEGRIVTLGRANILRVPDPGEWADPHAGGICVSLYDGDSSAPRVIAWQLASSTREAVTLTGRSDSGHALQMQIGIAGDAMRIRVTVSNPGDSTARLRIVCRAEFDCGPSREALLTYRDRSGHERKRTIRLDDGAADGGAILTEGELPQQEWVLAAEDTALRVRNRFGAEEAARCGFSWSFRGPAGLNINMSVGSPEVELAPGQQFALTSEYDWKVAERH